MAEGGGGRRVGLREPAVPIRYGNAGECMFIKTAKSRLALVQSIRGPLAIGYIVARGDDAIDSAVRRAQRCYLKIDPSHLSAATGGLQIPPYRLARQAPCDH